MEQFGKRSRVVIARRQWTQHVGKRFMESTRMSKYQEATNGIRKRNNYSSSCGPASIVEIGHRTLRAPILQTEVVGRKSASSGDLLQEDTTSKLASITSTDAANDVTTIPAGVVHLMATNRHRFDSLALGVLSPPLQRPAGSDPELRLLPACRRGVCPGRETRGTTDSDVGIMNTTKFVAGRSFPPTSLTVRQASRAQHGNQSCGHPTTRHPKKCEINQGRGNRGSLLAMAATSNHSNESVQYS